jgi:multiple sugar transport system substrate-binding protein
MGRTRLIRLAALASVVMLAVGACGGSTPSVGPASAVASAPASEGASPSAVASTAKPGQIINVGGKDHIVVRWYVGLGSGTNPAQIALQQTVVSDFNKLQDERTDGKMPIILSLEIVQNSTATDILKTEIASGSAPDLIGPVGIKGRAGFAGQFLDMTPLIEAAGFDMSQYPEKLVNTMKDGQTGALLGIPYAVYPSYIFVNKDLFDEAGLKYPPQ